MRIINVPVPVFEAMLTALAGHLVLLSLAAKIEADRVPVSHAPDPIKAEVEELTAIQVSTYAAQLASGLKR